MDSFYYSEVTHYWGVSVRPSAERFSPLPSCCSETAYEEHGVGPEPHTHPLMVVIEEWLATEQLLGERPYWL